MNGKGSVISSWNWPTAAASTRALKSSNAWPNWRCWTSASRSPRALDLALKHNLIHRDIKPGNILFNDDHEPKLVDFGLARNAEAEQESSAVTEGTPYYVAPEKIKREPETFLSDMYSLGATLYHALTGQVPFDAPTVEEVIMAQVQTPLTPPNLKSCRKFPRPPATRS